MKNLFKILILLNFQFILAQENFLVISENGLNIRQNTSIDSKKLGIFKGNEIIKVYEKTNIGFNTKTKKGFWYKVKFNNNTAFVFSGYLKPINLHKTRYNCEVQNINNIKIELSNKEQYNKLNCNSGKITSNLKIKEICEEGCAHSIVNKSGKEIYRLLNNPSISPKGNYLLSANSDLVEDGYFQLIKIINNEEVEIYADCVFTSWSKAENFTGDKKNEKNFCIRWIDNSNFLIPITLTGQETERLDKIKYLKITVK